MKQQPEKRWDDPTNPSNLDSRPQSWLDEYGLKPDHPWYVVVSEYSGATARKRLIQSHLRPQPVCPMGKLTAESWRDSEEERWKKKYPRSRRKFAVIEVPHNLVDIFR